MLVLDQAGTAYRCRDGSLESERRSREVDYEEGDTVHVIAGAWAGTTGV